MTSTKNVDIMGWSRRCIMEKRVKPQNVDPYKNRGRRREQLKIRRQKELALKIILFLVIIVAVIGGPILFKKYGPTKDRVDLNEYYGINAENQLAVIIDNHVIGGGGIVLDGVPYVEYSIVRDCLNNRFYVDFNENILLYTLPEGTISANVGSNEYMLQKEKHTVEYPILKMEGNAAYIALDFVQEYTNIEFNSFQKDKEEPNRVVIVSEWGEVSVATVKKDTQLRSGSGVKNPILKSLTKKSVVTVIEEEGNWKKIRTEDGYIGYIKKNCLKQEKTDNISRTFEKQVYSNISKDYTINLAWHLVEERSVNDSILSTIADTKGLTTIAPTWFTVSNTKGNIRSFANSQYVNYAHQSDIEVWGVVKDYDGGIDSPEETLQLLSYTSSREKLINQLMAEVLKTGLDGLNVEFKHVTMECGEHFIQFIRELALKCRQNGIVLAVNNYVQESNLDYLYLEEQGEVVDYVIVKGYDEHRVDSLKSGPIASIDFVRAGIEEILKVAPKEKIISAVPLFTRLWKEVPKTEEQLEREKGTESEKYSVNVTSSLYSMKNAGKPIVNAEAQIVVDEATGQNYAEWNADGATYKIWLEDEVSLEAKLKLLKEYDLAGNAVWRLGYEKSGTWDLILKYVN